MIHLIATITIRPGSLETVVAAARPCLEATRAEAGCISYELFQSVEEPEKLVFVERWKDRAALTAHFHAPHLVAWREAGGPYILTRHIEVVTDGAVEIL